MWSFSYLGCDKLRTQCTNVCVHLLCTSSSWKPCKVLYANITYFYSLSFPVSLLCSLVENYFVFLFISIFWPKFWRCSIVTPLFLQSWSNLLYQRHIRIHGPWPTTPSAHKGNNKFEILLAKIFSLKEKAN